MFATLCLKIKTFEKQHKKMSYLICYTFVFLLITMFITAIFLYNGKGFIWTATSKDGLEQHFNALMYFGDYLRTIFKNIFVDHHLSIPMWDFSMGYGADIMTTLHYYVFGDPLNLLSVFVSPRHTEYLYSVLILLRLYLAGLAFSYYCFFMNRQRMSTLLGTLTYVFCGYTIFASMRHPYFINPMIYLPLLLVGVEKIFKNKSPSLFIVMVGISAMSNFYFLYMLILLVVLYTIIRYFSVFKDNFWQMLPKMILQFIVYGIIGLAISAIMLLPVINLFMSASRSQDSSAFSMIYNLSYYQKFFMNFISFSHSGYFVFTGFSSLSLLSVFMLFMAKKHKELKVGFIILTLCICIPFMGYAFNGFSYLTNRWSFGYSFLIACIVAFTYDDLIMTCLMKKIILFGITIVYGFFVIIIMPLDYNIISIIISLLILSLFIMVQFKNFHVNKNIFQFLILNLVVISVSINAYYKYSPKQLNYINEFADFNTGYQRLHNSRAKIFNKLDDSSFYRYDEVAWGKNYLVNGALQQKQNSISFFYSLASGYQTQYLNEMESLNALSSYYKGVNYRTYLEILGSVKYFIIENNQKSYLPYGFNEEVYSSKKYKVMKNQFYLPLGYTYDSQLSVEDYEKLAPIQKQQALLQSVLIDDKDCKLPKKALKFANQKIPYTVSSYEGIKKTKEGFIVIKEGAEVKLQIHSSRNSELYTAFQNLSFTPQKDATGNYQTSAYLTVSSGQHTNTITLKNKYDNYYSGVKDFLVNTGYSEKQKSEIKLVFHNTGEYKCGNFSIENLSMDGLPQQVSKLKENVFEVESIETNRVVGSINLDKKKFLNFSIPYSKGWHMYVDGKLTKLYCSNTTYMGTYIDSGKHNIELVYETPYIKEAIMISCLGIVSLISICFYLRKKHDKCN